MVHLKTTYSFCLKNIGMPLHNCLERATAVQCSRSLILLPSIVSHARVTARGAAETFA